MHRLEILVPQPYNEESFLKKFSDVGDLESLAKCLDKNQIDMSNASNDLIYARTLLDQFFFMYKK